MWQIILAVIDPGRFILKLISVMPFNYPQNALQC